MFAKRTFTKAVLLSSVILATTVACERYDINTIAGNTYDRHNQIDVLSPHADLINVSYNLEYVNDKVKYFKENPYEGKSWIYASRNVEVPTEVVQIHLMDGSTSRLGADEKLGFRNFKTESGCYSTSGELPANVTSVIKRMEITGLTSSEALFVKTFSSDFTSADDNRTDLVYIRDLTSDGITCSDFSNSEAVSKEVNYKANHSFEVLG